MIIRERSLKLYQLIPMNLLKINEFIKDSYVIDTEGGKNGSWLNDISLIEPIPITEEWLLRFKFYKWGKYELWKQRLSYRTHLKHDGFTIDTSKRRSDLMRLNTYPFTKIQYVHQLQNLYFALTGRELTT
jgi:hypothetical protein